VNREAWPPALLTVAGLVAVNEARRLRFGAVTVPGPGLFPLVLAVGFTLVSLILLVAALRAPADAASAESGAAGDGGIRWKVLATLGVMLAYAFVLEPLGFVVATCGLLCFFFRALEGMRWTVAVAASALTSVVTYVIFKVWLYVRLPPGPWGL
jgi:putative tricarboxylic transport membrane protein